MYDKGSSGITGTDQWYFRNTSNRSSSWAGVNELYSYLTRGTATKGPYGSLATLTAINAYPGDIVQGHNGFIWRHSTIVTGFQGSNVMVTGRTAPGVYNDNVYASTIYGTQRLIKLAPNYYE